MRERRKRQLAPCSTKRPRFAGLKSEGRRFDPPHVVPLDRGEDAEEDAEHRSSGVGGVGRLQRLIQPWIAGPRHGLKLWLIEART
jgi:hypothetical protein